MSNLKINILSFKICVSHKAPVKVARQTQVIVLTFNKHVPPFWQIVRLDGHNVILGVVVMGFAVVVAALLF